MRHLYKRKKWTVSLKGICSSNILYISYYHKRLQWHSKVIILHEQDRKKPAPVLGVNKPSNEHCFSMTCTVHNLYVVSQKPVRKTDCTFRVYKWKQTCQICVFHSHRQISLGRWFNNVTKLLYGLTSVFMSPIFILSMKYLNAIDALMSLSGQLLSNCCTGWRDMFNSKQGSGTKSIPVKLISLDEWQGAPVMPRFLWKSSQTVTSLDTSGAANKSSCFASSAACSFHGCLRVQMSSLSHS